MIRIMMKDGSTIPSVAMTAPRIPPVRIPTNVAIFTARGPGVLSLRAMKSTSSASVSQPCRSASYCIMAIIAYPPPKVNAPIFRKVRNDHIKPNKPQPMITNTASIFRNAVRISAAPMIT